MLILPCKVSKKSKQTILFFVTTNRIHLDCRFKCSSSLRLHCKHHCKNKHDQCKVCLREFASATELNEHNQSPCEQPTIEHIKAEIIGQSQKKPRVSFECDECGRSFTEKWNMLKHRRIHSGEWPFECWLCHKM